MRRSCLFNLSSPYASITNLSNLHGRPGIIYLLSFFYLRHEVGFRCGLFASAAPLASTFAGALAYGITNGHSKLANWRLLFLVEGLATVIMTPIAFFFIPDSPDKARFLNAEEKEVVKSRAMRQVGTEPQSRIGGLNLKEFLLTLVDYKAWFVAVRGSYFLHLYRLLPQCLKLTWNSG
jgi:sugar phosphate permease